jgi:hypothetical protein
MTKSSLNNIHNYILPGALLTEFHYTDRFKNDKKTECIINSTFYMPVSSTSWHQILRMIFEHLLEPSWQQIPQVWY